MKNINALIKYEIINIRRGALIWITAILYAFGVQQAISNIHWQSNLSLSLVGLIKDSWLPLNFIMIPVLILSMKIGQSENEIFKTMEISHKEIMWSKIGVISIFNGVIFAANIIVAVIIGIMCKVSLQYFLYQSIGYIINTIIFLLVSSTLGLFIGQTVNKYVGDAVSFIIIIVSFISLSNFYKEHNIIVPLINIRLMASTFDVISYDKSYLYHNLFWIIITLIIFLITFYYPYRKEKSRKTQLVQKGILILASVACVYLAKGIYSMRPVFYNIIIKSKVEGNDNLEKYMTFYSRKDCGYCVEKYDMEVNINNKLKNNCMMEIKVNKDNIDSIELGLYKKLGISKVEVDGKKLNFKRTNHSFIVNLPKEYKRGETIKMKVIYEGEIKTRWLQGDELFFVRDNGIFLADVFEWYPKQNDNKIKDYNVNIKYNGKNKIYSNLDKEDNLRECKLQGKDKEIFVISGNLSEKKYKGYLFVGNEEYINDDQQCNDLISEIKKSNHKEIKKIIQSPFIPGEGIEDECYKKACLTSPF